MSKRPFKLRASRGGVHGTILPVRTFATEKARDANAKKLRADGWTVTTWRAT